MWRDWVNRFVDLGRRAWPALLLAAPAAIYVAAGLWLAARGFTDPEAEYRWLRTRVAAEEWRLEYLGWLYPHGSYLVLLPFTVASFARWPLGPATLVSAALIAAAFAWLYRRLPADWSRRERLAVWGGLALSPGSLWLATSGGRDGLLFAVLVVVFVSGFRMLEARNLRAVFAFSVAAALSWFVDERALWVVGLLLVFLVAAARWSPYRREAWALAGVVMMPTVIHLAAWAYLNWLYAGDPWYFFRHPLSAFRGVLAGTLPQSWAVQYGGPGAGNALLVLAALLLAAPAALLIFRLRPRPAALTVALAAAAAATAANAAFFVGHPLEWIGLPAALSVVALSQTGPGVSPRSAFALIMLGWAGALAIMSFHPSPGPARWQAAVRWGHRPAELALAEEVARWLESSGRPTWTDEGGSGPVLARMRRLDRLVLTHEPEFQFALLTRRLEAPQVLVRRAGAQSGARGADPRFEELVRSVDACFEVVFARGDWEVLRPAGCLESGSALGQGEGDVGSAGGRAALAASGADDDKLAAGHLVDGGRGVARSR